MPTSRLLASFALILALAGASATPAAAQVAMPTPEPLNDFLCYESRQRSLGRPGVTLADQFDIVGPSTVTVRRAKRLCAPADKNGEDPTAPNDAAHLTAYTIHQTSPRFLVHGETRVSPKNAILPPIMITLVRPDRLLVPAAKNVGSQVPDRLAAPIDHYKCYRVKGARQRLSGINVTTQFGAITVDVKRPRHLCTPVDKNGEGVIRYLQSLMCYQVRAVPRSPVEVSTNNQFEQATFDVFGIRELCVPAFAVPQCGDGVINQPGEECEPPGASAQCTSGTCNGACRCALPPSVCGNGIIEGIEDCDQGRCANGLECNQNCTCPVNCQQGACGYGGECATDGSCTQCGCQTTIEGGSSCSAFCFAASCSSSADCGPGNVCAPGGTQCCNACNYDCQPLNNHCPGPPRCGDGVVNQPGEVCDGADDNACPGSCGPDCSCLLPPCGDSVGPGGFHCGGECPDGYVCSIYLGTVVGLPCGCVPGSTPCAGGGDPAFPTCGGDCPEGQTCQAYTYRGDPPEFRGDGCGCYYDAPCDSGGGVCGGGVTCPSGQVCKLPLGGGLCGCE